MNLASVLIVTRPLLRDIHHGQIQHFQETLIGRKHRLGFCDLPQLTVKSFDCISRIDQATICFQILEIGGKIRPVVFPRFCLFSYISRSIFHQNCLIQPMQSLLLESYIHASSHLSAASALYRKQTLLYSEPAE